MTDEEKAQKTAEAARRLGAGPWEVTDVEDGDSGLIVTLFDGGKYIIVPDDRPDLAGRTGVMYLNPPTSSYAGVFPVFQGTVAVATPLTGDKAPVAVQSKLAQAENADIAAKNAALAEADRTAADATAGAPAKPGAAVPPSGDPSVTDPAVPVKGDPAVPVKGDPTVPPSGDPAVPVKAKPAGA
jgi:hypothetical protein